MKRTEKIEIRVSHDEKQTLSNLAKQEGESVSGLVRGLIEKYMALNTASTKRRLPKWQIAAMLLIAALIGHGLTLLPMHLHERGHQKRAALPTYVIHGVIETSAFSVNLEQKNSVEEITLKSDNTTWLKVRLSLVEHDQTNGKLDISICKRNSEAAACKPILNKVMNVERVAPSVLGHKATTGEFVHIFAQEMA